MNYQQYASTSPTLGGTLGGTMLVLFNLNLQELAKSAILAGVGAMVSFAASLFLNFIVRGINRRRFLQSSPSRL